MNLPSGPGPGSASVGHSNNNNNSSSSSSSLRALTHHQSLKRGVQAAFDGRPPAGQDPFSQQFQQPWVPQPVPQPVQPLQPLQQQQLQQQQLQQPWVPQPVQQQPWVPQPVQQQPWVPQPVQQPWVPQSVPQPVQQPWVPQSVPQPVQPLQPLQPLQPPQPPQFIANYPPIPPSLPPQPVFNSAVRPSANISYHPPTQENEKITYSSLPEGVGRSGGYQPKVHVTERYRIVGFISSGTYGRVYKAVILSNIITKTDGTQVPAGHEVAIKKFKPDKEGEQAYTGISQSAIREMSLCSEIRHANVIRLIEIILEDKCIFMVFDYAEHDLLQIIHHHTQQPRHPIPPATVKSIMFQLLNGCHYLHTNWIMHRDLKPANIMVTSSGEVKIGDLGLARRFDKPLHSLYSGDKVVVTIWYRAPELILGSYHYTPAIDMWAVGCIFAELLSLRPIFKGEEAKVDNKKTVPFQRNQMMKIMEIMGAPTKEKWPLLPSMPEFGQLNSLHASMAAHQGRHNHSSSANASKTPLPSNLAKWYHTTISNAPSSTNTSAGASTSLSSLGQEGYRLLAGLLEYDPEKRLTAAQALQMPLFSTGDRVSANAFDGLKVEYPHRRVSQDDNDIRTSSLPGTKRGVGGEDALLRPSKRLKE